MEQARQRLHLGMLGIKGRYTVKTDLRYFVFLLFFNKSNYIRRGIFYFLRIDRVPSALFSYEERLI